jgi:OOP family OmpA-OmpF porin
MPRELTVPFRSRETLFAFAIAAVVVLIACASPVPPDALVRAEEAYDTAAVDPEVMENAPVSLYEAKKELVRAQQAWDANANDPHVEHYAYVAYQRVEIARALASKRAADAEARVLSRERDQIVLEARSRQVDLARIESEQARKRAADLEKQLADLQAKKTDRGMVITLGDVLFDFNRAELRSGAQQNLYRLVTFLLENPDREVLIEGHTDSIGSEAYNLSLSERRAQSVQLFLTGNGINPGRTASMGFGKSLPVATNATEAGRQRNRRVEIVILDPGKKASQEIRR